MSMERPWCSIEPWKSGPSVFGAMDHLSSATGTALIHPKHSFMDDPANGRDRPEAVLRSVASWCHLESFHARLVRRMPTDQWNRLGVADRPIQPHSDGDLTSPRLPAPGPLRTSRDKSARGPGSVSQPRGSGHARRGRPARVRLQWRRRGHLSSHHHTWTNVCIRATARRPRTTAMGAELSAPRGAERPLLRSHNGPAYDQLGSVNSGHPVGPASVAARVEVVDICLRHDLIEAYEELCDNRLLPVSVLPR